MNLDEIYMERCLQLAALGQMHVAPNPMVGSVIVHNNRIIGEGYHQKYGQSHAEVNAVNSVMNKEIFKESTIYVTLEPCSHHGKTPPCADMIVRHGFKRAVIGTTDPNSQVSGRGIERLKQAGIDVTVGILEEKCREINKRFFTFHQKKRPYVLLKWAQSKDGFFDVHRTKDQKGVFWITQQETKSLVHKWRSEEESILVGKRTVEVDDPQLTVRAYHGKNPIRIIIDPQLQLQGDFQVFSNEVKTIVLNKYKDHVEGNIEYIIPSSFGIQDLLEILHSKEILSVMVEGGRTTIQHFIDSGLWDEARVLVGQNDLLNGVTGPQISGLPNTSYLFAGDRIYQYNNL